MFSIRSYMLCWCFAPSAFFSYPQPLVIIPHSSLHALSPTNWGLPHHCPLVLGWVWLIRTIRRLVRPGIYLFPQTSTPFLFTIVQEITSLHCSSSAPALTLGSPNTIHTPDSTTLAPLGLGLGTTSCCF